VNKLRFAYNLMVAAQLTGTAAHAYAQSENLLDGNLGAGNQASINQIGEVQRAAIEEHNILGGVLYSSIQQNGMGNKASVTLEGGDLSGSIVQNGNENRATLEIRDEHNRGSIEQYGNSNATGLQIDGRDKDVTLIQQGSGHAYGGSIKVGGDTPGGLPITIRQY
jgi:hypothetical protein